MYFYSRYLIYSLSSLSLHHSHVHDVGRPIPSARPPKHDARFQSAQFHERRVSRLRLGLGPIHRVHEPDDVIPGAIARCIPRAALAPVSSRGASLGGWRPTSQPHSSSKDSTSLSDASAVNRRESSTQGRARALHSRPRSFYVGHRLAWTCRGRVAVASEVSVARSRDTPWTLSSRSIDAEKPRHGQQAAARASRARFTRI